MTRVELYLRAGSFLLVLALMWLRERHVPAFAAPKGQGARMSANGALAVLGAVAARLVAPAGLAGVALYAAQSNLGLFHAIAVPGAIAGIVSIVVLDVVVYWQHRLFHRLPWLWHIHAVHHADPHIDVTTAVRFHPVEIVLSLLLKAAVVLALGAPAWATIAFEALLAAAAIFNHANTRFSRRVEHVLRLVVVTPALHRVHHADSTACQDRNFGFSVSAWDRLFGTYLAPESAGDRVERFGLNGIAPPAARSIAAMLSFFGGMRR